MPVIDTETFKDLKYIKVKIKFLIKSLVTFSTKYELILWGKFEKILFSSVSVQPSYSQDNHINLFFIYVLPRVDNDVFFVGMQN